MGVKVWVAADTLGYPSGAGHLWAYLNWALGLRSVGCQVVWAEPVDTRPAPEAISRLTGQLRSFGLEQICLFDGTGEGVPLAGVVPPEAAEEADLLLNMAYEVPPGLVARFRRSAMLDIDPGMTQTWIAAGDIEIASHDIYLTTGEGVATGSARVPETGIDWRYATPCVALDAWPATPPPAAGAYTTVTHWWGDKDFVMPDGQMIDNTKRVSFLPYFGVARATGIGLELAVAADDLEEDADLLANQGWDVADPADVAGTPERYRSYIQRSRGEFSCAKPAYAELQTGWISDRTVCYLATGRPVIVQHTGPSSLLDEARGEGVFRFTDAGQATAALVDAERDHPRQCKLARALAEEHFDASQAAERVLEWCLG
jgi:hypothetical protein